MKIKIAEAEGVALDWLVAKCEGLTDYICHARMQQFKRPMVGSCNYPDPDSYWPFEPSTSWAQGGPIIERLEGFQLKIWLQSESELKCEAHIHNYDGDHVAFASTPLVAAMRCYVGSALGLDADLPETLS